MPQAQEVMVDAGGTGRVETLAGTLTLPPDPVGIVAFAHGSGSSRHSPRNRYVAGVLLDGGLGTLLVDLLTPAEDAADRDDGRFRFDIGLLAGRTTGIVDWLARQPETRQLPVGLFGASTGAAAALTAAAERPGQIGAVVSRGGRPDLAGTALGQVRAPVLLLVGGQDTEVLALNADAARRLGGEHRLQVVAGAGHLFTEPGTLAQVAVAARDWFGTLLPA